jgi:hypothetical protein
VNCDPTFATKKNKNAKEGHDFFRFKKLELGTHLNFANVVVDHHLPPKHRISIPLHKPQVAPFNHRNLFLVSLQS